MADDNSARQRSSDPIARGPATPANDPLAELARLIGQNDPFAGYARPDPQQHASGTHYPAAPAPAQGYPAETPQGYSDPRYAAAPPRYSADQPAHQEWPGTPAPPSFYPPNDPLGLPSDHYAPQAAPQYDSRGYAASGYPDQNYQSPSHSDPNYAGQGYPGQGYPGHDYQSQGYQNSGYQPQPYQNADYHSPQPEPPGFGAGGYPADPDRQGFSDRQGFPLYPQEPNAGSMPPPHDDEFYDDAPRGDRRKGLLTVAAVLALAVVGTAGAFGYRSLFGSSGAPSPPPVIRASGEPSKVAPPPATPDPSAGKFSYDRFGDAGKDEQVVRREEKPVDVSRAAAARTVFPGAPIASSPPPNRPVAPGTTATANPPSAIGEPRRVRTVPIRPDQPDNGAAGGLPPAAAQSMSVAPPRTSQRVAAAPPPSANAPLSLSPDANSLPPPAAQDSAPPPSRPARTASAPPSGGGSYLVQVSSQRSEAEAQNAYRGIQSRFSSVLANQPHTVRRADLGSKGVYYRAMVGPFASRDEAVQVCVSLKQAGGDCVVQQ